MEARRRDGKLQRLHIHQSFMHFVKLVLTSVEMLMLVHRKGDEKCDTSEVAVNETNTDLELFNKTLMFPVF